MSVCILATSGKKNRYKTVFNGGDATKYIYLWDRSGHVIAMLQLDYVDNMVRKGSDADYLYRIWIGDK